MDIASKCPKHRGRPQKCTHDYPDKLIRSSETAHMQITSNGAPRVLRWRRTDLFKEEVYLPSPGCWLGFQMMHARRETGPCRIPSGIPVIYDVSSQELLTLLKYSGNFRMARKFYSSPFVWFYDSLEADSAYGSADGIFGLFIGCG
ncbi:hypothetical protein AVEN_261552-1 [Araneus ventricosus]|uniref:Uncharacterized protein n=1 Tax=Araneus ventricosus TaxID=182803 RepID=A0A4Y2RIM8_ARAVE|nr:hypothetical protein AVEN_261552-1 [Araneus ventricosus]